MKKFLTLFAAVLMLLSVLSGCKMGSNQSSNSKSVASPQELKPFGKYKKTVTYTIGKATPGIPKLPKGQTYEDNAYTKYLKDTLNIQSKDKFEAQTGDPYDQKVSMAVASGDLPDIMAVNADTLRQLVANDSIADLTDVYKSSASDFIKAKYNSYNGRALKAATFDGKLMALPSTQNANIPTMLWIRQDWLDKLGLKAPKTVDDMEKVLTAFVKKDPGNNGKGNTVGLALSKSVGGNYGSLFVADNIFATYNSFPRQWIKQNGKVVYGSTTNETKQGLSKLADWYKKGLIDPQMAVRDSIESLIISGQAGAFFGPWWSGDYPLNSAIKKNPKANWKPYIISKNGDGKITAYTQNPVSEFYVVRKGFKHPELLPKIASAINDKLVREDKNYKPVVDFVRGGYDGGKPLNVMINFNDATAQMYKDLKATVDGKKDPKSLSLDDSTSYNNIENYLKNPKNPDPNAWSGYTSRIVAGKLMANTPIKEVNPVFFDQTKSMKLKWANLVKLEDETFLKIVTGQKSVNDFGTFVKQWKSTGGTQITQEVVQAIKEK
ncbi:ABC transporter substrate-binding protein [Sporolactobacillus kofuensis]|uniref:ABC transporter substrate-binding protein n=1 Tax=Sporolactobacillus kofuensis TaxID=269672 RepID=A0ABW1WEP0_9BACL|nr:ABC transporter substrate-binding protein [Sporolactobacillus kofuensis]MCO7176040.1 ABC transporter substrate-binding protein [Sporolactobacillus kofuensis]